MELEKFKTSITKTGFVLEYKVSIILDELGWNTLNNRYYIDDIKGIDREIDIIAYKAREIDGAYYYTALIISCKKSEKDVWSFLTKKMSKNDPNVIKYPMHNWSNIKELNYMIDTKITEETIEKTISSESSLNFIYSIRKQVFAFQQIDKNTYKVNNDKDIYNSIITSIKALEYERGSLNNRKKEKVFYNFNLLSIFDGEMVELSFDSEEPTVKLIDNIKYLNRHIVNKREGFYRVHFIKFEAFKNYLTTCYEKLHDYNAKYYSQLRKNYYIEKFTDKDSLKVFLDDIEQNLKMYVKFFINRDYKECVDVRLVNITYNDSDSVLYISLELSGYDLCEQTDIINGLNEDESLMIITKDEIEKIYRYTGDVKYIDDCSFAFIT